MIITNHVFIATVIKIKKCFIRFLFCYNSIICLSVYLFSLTPGSDVSQQRHCFEQSSLLVTVVMLMLLMIVLLVSVSICRYNLVFPYLAFLEWKRERIAWACFTQSYWHDRHQVVIIVSRFAHGVLGDSRVECVETNVSSVQLTTIYISCPNDQMIAGPPAPAPPPIYLSIYLFHSFSQVSQSVKGQGSNVKR